MTPKEKREYDIIYRAKNRQKIKDAQRQWYIENTEYAKKRSKKSKDANPVKIKKYAHEYYVNHKEKYWGKKK